MKTLTIKLNKIVIACLLSGTIILRCADPVQTQPRQTHVMIFNAGEPVDVISRHIYGHFTEHLGRGIYDGIWFENDAGDYVIREDVVEALLAIKIPNLCWPGGCLADYYFWEDGIGPKDERP